MAVYPSDASSISQTLEVLRRGDCIGLPTETVYGLAADGLNAEAVAKIFEIKKRPSFDPLILHVPQNYEFSQICAPNALANQFIQAFWPGPLTLILPKKEIVPDIVTSGLPTVAVRCPNHPVAQDILKKFNKPLAAPSANRFGRITPTSAQAVHEELGDAVSIILDAGNSPIGLESTIVDCTSSIPVVLRQGAIILEELQKICKETHIAAKDEKGKAPGTLESHYAPLTSLYLSRESLHNLKQFSEKYAYLFWQKIPDRLPKNYRCLTPSGSSREAAVNLFKYLRELDSLKCEKIIVDLIPSEDIGPAIQDRITRASSGMANA